MLLASLAAVGYNKMVMKRLLRGVLIATIAFGVLAGLVTAPVGAAETGKRESITLSPVNKRLTLDAGTNRTEGFQILNDGETDYDFMVSGSPYYVNSGTYDDTDFSSNRSNADAHKWVVFEKTRYRIKAGESVYVNFTIKVPANAAPGGHYGIIFAETDSEQKGEGGAGVTRNKRVGMPLFLTVNGTYTMGGTIDDIQTSFIQSQPPVQSKVRLTNTGNSDFMAKTVYRVQDVFGGVKFTREQEYIVLPDTSRDVTLMWDDSHGFGLWWVTADISLLDQKKASSSLVLIAPVWAYVLVSVAVLAGIAYLFIRKRR